jgi:uncharacterized protein YbaR (Trm112 family)
MSDSDSSTPNSSPPVAERPADSVDPKLLEILVCPLTKCPLEYDADKQELISRAAKLAYPIRDGIPIMLPDEARRLD